MLVPTQRIKRGWQRATATARSTPPWPQLFPEISFCLYVGVGFNERCRLFDKRIFGYGLNGWTRAVRKGGSVLPWTRTSKRTDFAPIIRSLLGDRLPDRHGARSGGWSAQRNTRIAASGPRSSGRK